MHKHIIITLGLVVAAAPAHAMIGGGPVADPEHSGMVSLQAGNSTCGAVVIAPDLLLGSARCFGGSMRQHPELIGWFMGSQDSDGNPVREVVNDRLDNFAFIRLTRPLVGAPQFALWHGQPQDVTSVRCFAFGPRDWEVFPTGATLSWADYAVSGPAQSLTLTGPTFTAFDMGGVCLTLDGSNEIAAIVKSSSEYVSATLARSFVTEARTTFELVSQPSNLCVGNFPNTTSVWQFPCLLATNSGRVNQQWLIRRLEGDGRFQLRSTRFPDLCLGPSSSADGAAVVIAPCAPVINDPLPPFLPQNARPEQLWDVAIVAGDAMRLVNVATAKCLDLAGASTSVGAGLVQATCSGAPTQRFLVDADRFPAGTHRVASYVATQQCMDVSFASQAWGSAIGFWYCDGQPKQRWDLAAVDGTTVLHNVKRSWPGNVTCLAVPGADPTPGVGVIQWPCGPWADHQWLFRWTPGFYGYRLHPNHAPAQCLTRPPLAPSAQLVQSTCDGGVPNPAYDAQRWIVE